MTDYTNISAKAMLVSLQISTWSARKFDKKATADVAEENKAEAQAGRYNKHLFAGAAEHKAVMQAAGKARDVNWQQTLPWSDTGWRLLPTSNYMHYQEAMRAEKAKFDAAVAEFSQTYETLRANAKAQLGDLYNEDDYPEREEALKRFSWAIEIAPVPSAGDLRVELPEGEIAAIEARVQERVEGAAKAAMADAWARLREAVARVQKATDGDGIVRGTLVDHLRDVAVVLGRLNLSDDQALEQVRQRVLGELAGIEVEDLRKDEALRADTKRRADAILASMTGLIPAA